MLRLSLHKKLCVVNGSFALCILPYEWANICIQTAASSGAYERWYLRMLKSEKMYEPRMAGAGHLVMISYSLEVLAEAAWSQNHAAPTSLLGQQLEHALTK